ncbi:zinc-binding alcohol dehydrogenase family protein [Levilactobacillus suantsaii]|uniref:zinc-binding alcohol dehydrogenase family protein n=1 Tax=Levilactobacillus suantsaii TaxID=2292255 RepID=UPI00148230C1|nr:zinc-binding alcohol dehydrogenase family protein [Levilactobacillus suantsaii]QMU08449.1 zinc-binding alcohol dehydrogenase family protein [Levilactobacillus suantsaii]
MNSVVGNDTVGLTDVPLANLVASGRDVLVQVKAISINPVDIKTTAHTAAAQIRGYDAAGIVVGVGPDVTKFKVNDRVFYAGTTTRNGSYADQQLVDERLVARAPALDFADLAALPLTWLTAAEILFEKLSYTPAPGANVGHTILVINGAGGVGSILTQLAHYVGLTVIATSSPRNFAWLKAHGVDHVVDYHQSLVSQVKQFGLTIDSSLNLIDTGQYFDELVELVRPFGHLVNITSTAQPIDIMKLQPKSLSFDWELMFTKSGYHDRMASQGQSLAWLADLLASGHIKSTRTQTIQAPITAATLKQAHADLRDHHMVGKLVVENTAHN